MQRRRLLSTLAAVLSARFGAAALAQPRPDDDRQRERPPGPPERGGPRGRPEVDRRGPGFDRRGPGFDRRGPERGPERVPPTAWRRGGRLPPEYRSRSYVVDDWRAHRLPRPPRGHYWVAVGGDYLLVAIATGIIVQVIAAQ